MTSGYAMASGQARDIHSGALTSGPPAPGEDIPITDMGKDLRPSPCVYRDGGPTHDARGRDIHYAASAPFAFSASAAKPFSSCTAMSASTLRSRVMPAFIRPLMKRL
jgi:hypothetical protein